MALSYSRIQVAAPSAGLAAALQAGGALAIGTTYYYRVIAVRWYQSSVFAFSAASAEVSATPDAANRTIQVSWNAVADATGYILQRTTTSGSYPLGSRFTLGGINQGYRNQVPVYITGLSLTDNGGASGNIAFEVENIDFSVEYPVIVVSGAGASDILTPWDIYSQDAGGGWGLCQGIGSPFYNSNTYSEWKRMFPLCIKASLYLSNLTWRHESNFLYMYGAFCPTSTVALEFGYKNPTAASHFAPAAMYSVCIPIMYQTADFSSYTVKVHTTTLNCAANSFANNFVVRNASGLSPNGSWAKNPFINMSDAFSLPANLTFKKGIIGSNVLNGICLYSNPIDSIVEGKFRQYSAILSDFTATNSTAYLYWAHNIILRNIKIIYPSDYDLYIYGTSKGKLLEDCTLTSKSQTIENPYINLNGIAATLSMLFAYTAAIKVVDQNGNPISGATVSLVDVLGNSGLYTDSLATYSTTLNDTDVTSSLTVSDGTKFSIGNIIRLICYAELMQVTNVVGNVLTVSRGYGGTGKRASSPDNNNKVLKAVANLSTAATGIPPIEYRILHRELATISGQSGVDYENGHVTAGKLIRTYFTPYTLTITKAGYLPYQDKITIDRKMDLEVALRYPDYPFVSREVAHAVA